MNRKYLLRRAAKREKSVLDLGAEAGKQRLFMEMINEGFCVDSARIVSENPDAVNLHPRNIVEAYMFLRHQCDLPHYASAHMASSDGIFRDTNLGLIQAALKYLDYTERGHPELEAAEKAVF